MPSISELISMGFGGYKGWNDEDAANADFRNTGGAGKWTGGGTTGGGGTSSSSLPKFEFDQAAAEKAAMEQLRPYYEKLLAIYNGDVGMAKKRMEEDYARGLRYKQDATQTGLADNAAAKAESARKFKLALGDLDQEMNTRGLFNSGIKTTNQQNAQADQAYKEQTFANTARDLTKSEAQYKETADVDRTRFLQDNGFLPVTDVNGFYSNPQKKLLEIGHQAEAAVQDKVTQDFNKAWTYSQTASKPIVTATPQNWTEVLNNSLKLQGLPTTG
jgi:hypothetical protein